MKDTLNNISQAMEKTMAQVLGIEVTEITRERVVATMPVDHRTHQPYGILHGGASVALAETVASLGGMFLVAESGMLVMGQEINANHIRSVKSGIVTAIGVPIHQGASSQVWEIKIYTEDKKLVCISRCTLAVRKAK